MTQHTGSGTGSRSEGDIWSRWLLERRFGGDEEEKQRTLQNFLYPWRDQILQYAALGDGETLLDVGCGDGLIGFGALKQNPTCRVIFSDISQALLDHTWALAQEMGLASRVEFVHSDATALNEIPDEHVDVVTMRSVLLYVEDRAAAFRAFHRVLRPGGRISLSEPINNYFRNNSADEHPDASFDQDATSDPDAETLLQVFDRKAKSLLADPMPSFSEKDLLQFAEEAGFREIRLTLQVEIVPEEQEPTNWKAAFSTAANPFAPTLGEVLRDVFGEEETQRLEVYLQQLSDQGNGEAWRVERSARVFLYATK